MCEFALRIGACGLPAGWVLIRDDFAGVFFGGRCTLDQHRRWPGAHMSRWPGTHMTCATAGVPATKVADWAGRSVEVLPTIYAKCIKGRDQVWFERIEKALRDD